MILKGLESAIVTLAEEISPNRYRNFIKKTLEKNMTVPVPIMPWVSSALRQGSARTPGSAKD